MSLGIGPSGSTETVAALQALLSANPADRVARHNYAVALRTCGHAAEGLAEIERCWAEGLHLPETATMRGHLLADAGRFAEAIAAYRTALADRPDLIEAQSALASLLPQVGRGAEALDAIGEAIRRVPHIGMVWVEAMRLAKSHGDYRQLLIWADAATARFGADTMVVTFAANALSQLGRDGEALARLDAALAAEPSYAAGHATRAHILLRLGEAQGAVAAALAATRLAPLDQSGWALLTIAWRLTEDAREDWLCGYDRYVMLIDLGLDPALPAMLAARHMATAHPADQSLRSGTQTHGNLFESADSTLQTLAHEIKSAIERRLATLPHDPAHPFLSRNTGEIGFATSWSVRLARSGFHISHIHPAGWLSSAYYVHLPREVAGGTGQGALTFGVPDAALGFDLAPRRVVQPREGQIAVFPSYLWHGTTPFDSADARMTVAFDALPVDNGAIRG